MVGSVQHIRKLFARGGLPDWAPNGMVSLGWVPQFLCVFVVNLVFVHTAAHHAHKKHGTQPLERPVGLLEGVPTVGVVSVLCEVASSAKQAPIAVVWIDACVMLHYQHWVSLVCTVHQELFVGIACVFLGHLFASTGEPVPQDVVLDPENPLHSAGEAMPVELLDYLLPLQRVLGNWHASGWISSDGGPSVRRCKALLDDPILQAPDLRFYLLVSLLHPVMPQAAELEASKASSLGWNDQLHIVLFHESLQA
mmetsp:Transcript_3729/g.5587  ORF Transcript_3729/g.5587 Transcript_3729/m.5587 type:complete len:252 (+) Transcript_3729:327-1082(+)